MTSKFALPALTLVAHAARASGSAQHLLLDRLHVFLGPLDSSCRAAAGR